LGLCGEKDKKPDEYNALLASEALELDAIDTDIEAFLSDTLIAEANELDVPLPEGPSLLTPNANWHHYHPSGRSCLAVEGRHQLRAAIDELKARRSERRERHLKIAATIITALTGLVGVIIGLISILRHS